MTEEATTIPAAPGTPESAESVWERTVAAPITKDDVRGKDPKAAEAAPVIPDRALVTGQLEELYADTTPKSDPLLDRLAQLEQSLVPTPEPEHPGVHAELVKLREELAARDEAAAEAVRAEEREARLRTVREGFVESLRETDSFPGIVAAGFEEKVFEKIHAAQQSGEEVSEEKILSDTESELWALYEVLHTVKAPTQSEEPTQSEATQTPTLTPTLTAEDNAATVEDLLSGGDRVSAAAEVWARTVG